MINEKLEAAFNEQINNELYSEYLYLAMKIYFVENNLTGFANWLDIQSKEEHAHAMGMLDYLGVRNGSVKLKTIEEPFFNGETPIEIFEEILKHEENITSRINALLNVAEETKDKAAIVFLNWYIKEQVEEEASVASILAKLKLIGNDKKDLLFIDKDLATRVFNQPTID